MLIFSFKLTISRCGGSGIQLPSSYITAATSQATPTLSLAAPSSSSVISLITQPSPSTTSLTSSSSPTTSSMLTISTPLGFGNSHCYVQSDRNFPHPADARNIALQLLHACLPNENDMHQNDPIRYWSQIIDNVGYWYSVSWIPGCVLTTGATVENVGMPFSSNHPHCVDIFQQMIHECK